MFSLPPANKVKQGNIFTHVCLFIGAIDRLSACLCVTGRPYKVQAVTSPLSCHFLSVCLVHHVPSGGLCESGVSERRYL